MTAARAKTAEPKPARVRRPRTPKLPDTPEVLKLIGRGALAAVRSPDTGRIAVAGLFAAAFVAASLRVRERVLETPALVVDRTELSTAALPAFLSERAREDLLAMPLPEQVSAFRPELVPAIAYGLGRIPWVERVASVKLTFEGTARVTFALEAARPIARMKERGQEVLVARSRRRVPHDRCTCRPMTRIEGLPLEGSAEREASLEDALAIVAALEAKGLVARIGLEAIRIAGKREAFLELASGTRIEWGRLASSPSLTTDERVARLEAFLKKGPPLDQVERMALMWDDPVYVLRPVAPPPAEGTVAAAAARSR